MSTSETEYLYQQVAELKAYNGRLESELSTLRRERDELAAQLTHAQTKANIDAIQAESLQAALSELSAVRARLPQLQPIETAPRDGTAVLLRMGGADQLPDYVIKSYANIWIIGNFLDDACYWRVCAPGGLTGIGDKWLAGWMPLAEWDAQGTPAQDTPKCIPHCATIGRHTAQLDDWPADESTCYDCGTRLVRKGTEWVAEGTTPHPFAPR